MPRRLAIAAFSALLIVLPFEGQSLAHVFDAGTSVKARRIPTGTVERRARVLVVGKLQSSVAACRQGELVELKRRARTLRTDLTDAEGEFRFKIRPRKTIRVFVQFDGSVETSYGHSHTCGGSRSQNIRLKVERPPRTGGGGGGANCHPSYPKFCIPPPPPDLDCDQVNGNNFTVVGSDPHGFDGDNDGVGCET
jgi:hypothetical protein